MYKACVCVRDATHVTNQAEWNVIIFLEIIIKKKCLLMWNVNVCVHLHSLRSKPNYWEIIKRKQKPPGWNYTGRGQCTR